MKDLYYLIWVDSIAGFKKYNPNRTDWKSALLILNTWLHAANLWIIVSWLRILGLKIYLAQLPFATGTMLNSFLSFCIQYVLIFAILNYFLIFYKERYKILIKKYPNKEGRTARLYGLGVTIFTFITGVTLFIYNNQ